MIVTLDVVDGRRDGAGPAGGMAPTNIAKALKICRASVYQGVQFRKKVPILRYHRLVSQRPRERALAPATAAWKYGLWIQYAPIPDSVAMHCSRLVK
jgi:hypothetical protein